MCDSKKVKFVKEQEASGLSGSIGIDTSLNTIPLLVHDMVLRSSVEQSMEILIQTWQYLRSVFVFHMF